MSAADSWNRSGSAQLSTESGTSRPYSLSIQSMRSRVRISRRAMVSRRWSRGESPSFRASVCTAIFTLESGLRSS